MNEDNVINSAEILRGAIGRAMTMRAFMFALAYGLPVGGVGVLILRFIMPDVDVRLLIRIASACVIFLFAVQYYVSRKTMPSLDKCIAAVDAKTKAGGMLKSFDEVKLAGLTIDTNGEIPSVTYVPERRLIIQSIVAAILIITVIAAPKSLF